MAGNVQGGLRKRWSRQTWSARLVARQIRDDIELARSGVEMMRASGRFPVVPLAYVGELPTDGESTFLLALDNKQRFRVTVKEIDHRGRIGPIVRTP